MCCVLLFQSHQKCEELYNAYFSRNLGQFGAVIVSSDSTSNILTVQHLTNFSNIYVVKWEHIISNIFKCFDRSSNKSVKVSNCESMKEYSIFL